ncbi:MAG TPA: tetratricopeptide repeat protein [Thermoanaerobaculia bacterium]|nr:tetratricopeptide repeat protein [Thermoanaerobaculia bacterium]
MSGRGLVVVGTGVTLAAVAGTERAGLASWEGLLRDGIAHCVRFARQNEAWAAALRVRLAAPRAEDLLAVAGEVCAALNAPGLGEMGRWLRDTVGCFETAQREELEALRELGLPLATTNYDGLLEAVTGLAAATWQDTAVVEDLLHGKAPRAILHLHGYWERPESVILDPAAYERAAPVVQEWLRQVRASHTLLFVGCGEGLADPNWAALRRWSRAILAGSRYRHFRLCLTGEVAELEREHPPEERIFPVPYGDGFGELAPFLRRLRSPAAGAPGAPQLPVPGRCFGREEQVAALVAAACAARPRQAAVLGPPGVGKTTVTVEALHCQAVVARFGARRWFVRCEAATSRGTLFNAIALALGIELGPEGQGGDPEARILGELARGPALLVLDNAETPLDAEAAGGEVGFEELLARLAALPELALVASFRGAQRPFRPSWRETIAVAPLAPEAAREAFLDVAGEAYRGDPLVDTLVAEVGHLPLALVLLASQAEGSPLAEIRRRWRSERTRLLRRGRGDSRETSFEASVALSVESPRLTEEARRLAALLALLPDGMAEDDLLALAPEDGAESAGRLRRVGLALPRTARLRLYAPIREVLAATLPATAEEGERLLGHYLGLAGLGEHAGAEGGREAFERLAPELGNLEALLGPALDGSAPGPAVEAVLALVELGRFSDVVLPELFELALAATRRSGSPETLARCLYRLGTLSLNRSDHDGARIRYEEALPLYRLTGDLLGEANCIKGLGDIALERSDHDGARARYEEALPLFRRVGHLLGEANCIQRLGVIALARSDHAAARSRFEEALPLFRRVGGLLGEANCIIKIGDIALERSDHNAARARYEEALPLYQRAGDLRGEANCIKRLGDIARARSDHDAARTWFEEALSLYRRIGSILGEANCIMSLGDIALARSDHDAAGARYEEALPLYRRVGDLLGEASCIRRLGNIALERSDHDGAGARYEEALPLYRRVGSISGEANSIQGLGDIALGRSDYDAAGARYEEALQLYRRVGSILGEANCILRLGDIALARGDENEARDRFVEALSLYSRIAEPYSIGETHRRLARLARTEAERRRNVDAARAAWRSIDRPDLIAGLDQEFLPGKRRRTKARRPRQTAATNRGGTR